MMKSISSIYQIYFDDIQLGKIEFIPYKNENCTIFFENSAIIDLIRNNKHRDSRYFGVFSYQVRNKTRLINRNKMEFNKDSILLNMESLEHDIIYSQQNPPHDIISYANRFHPNFSKYFKEVMNRVGYDWKPTILNNVILCNFFTAKSEIYQRYVDEMLSPAMGEMINIPELMDDSKYQKKLPERLRKSFGINHYPYHPFICERMISYFIHIHNLKCLNC